MQLSNQYVDPPIRVDSVDDEKRLIMQIGTLRAADSRLILIGDIHACFGTPPFAPFQALLTSFSR
jgi:hypothetical protein